MKTALTTLMLCGLIAGAASAEKFRDPNAPVISRFPLMSNDRVADCLTVSGLPVGTSAYATFELTEDCCDWYISSCGVSSVDNYFYLRDSNNSYVTDDDDSNCSYACAYGPAAIGSSYVGLCLPAGMYTLEIYVYSYRDENCTAGSTPIDFDICYDFCGGVSSTHDTPVSFELGNAFPNPFNPSTTIEFTMAETANASLKVYNVAGAEVATLVNGLVGAGAQSVVFDASNLTSGVYFYALEVAGTVQTRKMVLAK